MDQRREQDGGAIHPADQIQDRLINFAVRIIQIADALPATPAGLHIAGQILRSGTSPAPNYGEPRGAESRDDFIHKLGIVLKELNETMVWLLVIDRGSLIKAMSLRDDIDETDQLSRSLRRPSEQPQNTAKAKGKPRRGCLVRNSQSALSIKQ